MAGEHLYGDRAEIYDVIYGGKDYEAEADALAARLRGEGVPDGARILEAACGTGNFLVPLRDQYVVEGFDLSDDMLAVARRKLSGVPLWQADLADFEVEHPFDVLLCMFSSIGYLHPEARLRRAARCCAAALRPGGVLVVEPWVTAEVYDVGRPTVQVGRAPGVEVARATVAGARGDMAVLEMHYLVARRGQPVEHFSETHELWLATTDTLLRAFGDAGFDVRFDEEGLSGFGTPRGLLVGHRR